MTIDPRYKPSQIIFVFDFKKFGWFKSNIDEAKIMLRTLNKISAQFNFKVRLLAADLESNEIQEII